MASTFAGHMFLPEHQLPQCYGTATQWRAHHVGGSCQGDPVRCWLGPTMPRSGSTGTPAGKNGPEIGDQADPGEANEVQGLVKGEWKVWEVSLQLTWTPNRSKKKWCLQTVSRPMVWLVGEDIWDVEQLWTMVSRFRDLNLHPYPRIPIPSFALCTLFCRLFTLEI